MHTSWTPAATAALQTLFGKNIFKNSKILKIRIYRISECPGLHNGVERALAEVSEAGEAPGADRAAGFLLFGVRTGNICD